MNLNQLRVFCAIVEEGSFRQAGEKTFLSQPSVSQYIAALEKNYDVKLFLRRGRSISHPEGRTLYILAQDLFSLLTLFRKSFGKCSFLNTESLHRHHPYVRKDVSALDYVKISPQIPSQRYRSKQPMKRHCSQ